MFGLTLNTLIMALASPLAVQGVPIDTTGIAARASAPLGNGVPLRIMPLGASITFGLKSSDGNGYRAALRDMIVNPPADSYGGGGGGAGQGAARRDEMFKSVRGKSTARVSSGPNKVNMVGSRKAGTMVDNDVEGWSGYRIEQVHDKAMAAESAPKYKPNVVLVNAGTNDAAQNFQVATAGERMEAMLRDLWAVSPRAVVVLSTLLVNQDEATERNVVAINKQLRALVARLRDEEKKKIVLAEMHGRRGPRLADLADGTHPTDEGYRKMANIWYASLRVASDRGWLQAPEPVPGVPDDGAA
ncbi:carbohydrate esterase family 3 protein [Thermothelomyces thermophilus ATCC 42464]|uniref:Carbohydrate esterase family 3 protein n=1 Tax=Thermothelomyces thermophilus (strain ATCC 42464 / BCRC 31852 / DSM 1799) TaxID=573729 RepID=G2QLY9_THET4|nr:carbohydrate esterase family 3 protein [Thermothelomyces thermophilus ATCC 42464]AEO60969.1 carbohydrate esterase family 3 protein [Thermothelomyces thermophilus ATCC 42464]